MNASAWQEEEPYPSFELCCPVVPALWTQHRLIAEEQCSYSQASRHHLATMRAHQRTVLKLAENEEKEVGKIYKEFQTS